MKLIIKISFTFVFVCLMMSADGKALNYLLRSPKSLLMGDAYTAVADDAYTLFYNPAALGRHQGLSVNFINPDVGVTNVLREMDRFNDFPSSDPVAISDRILGFPFYLRAGATPGLKMEHFGLSLFASMNTDLELRNAIHPILSADYNYDRGIIMGYAYTIGNSGSSGKRGRRGSGGGGGGSQTSFGGAVKNMNRQGIHQSFDLFGLSLLNKITSGGASDMQSLRDSLGYSHGNAWGGDLGVEQVWKGGSSQMVLGLSALDIFDTQFNKTKGTGTIPNQPMTMNFGSAWSQDFFLFHYTLSADVHPIMEPIEIKRKLHFGAEFGIPLISLLLGWNGGYLSYGAAIEIWPISLYAGFYSVELGNKYHEKPGERALIYLTLLDFSFDA